MSKRPFFVLGAPTDAMINALIKFKPDAIFVNASFETFLKTNSAKPIKEEKDSLKKDFDFDVHKMPTNFRAHADDRNKVQAGIRIEDVESFIDAQENVSQAVKDMIEGKRYKKCKVYFASVPRVERPFRIYVDKDTGKTVINDNKNPQYHISQADLDNFFNEIVLPIFKDEKLNPNEKLTEEIEKYSQYKASYVVDTLSVISACLAGQEGLWDTYTVAVGVEKGMYTYDTKRKEEDIFHGASKPEKGVPFCRVKSYEENDNGNIWSYKTSEIGELIKKTKALLSTFTDRSHSKIWDEAFVWHDTFLNDIDDPVAINMIEKLTSGEVQKRINYEIAPTAAPKAAPVKYKLKL